MIERKNEKERKVEGEIYREGGRDKRERERLREREREREREIGERDREVKGIER